MYYKILLDGQIVDAAEELSYVGWQEKNGILLSCDAEKASGILSSDCSVIWHLASLPEFPVGEYDTVTAAEIGEDEYLRLKAQLGGEEPDEEPEENGEEHEDETVEEETEEEEVLSGMTSTQLLIEIGRMKREIELLEECLLEVSQILYA